MTCCALQNTMNVYFPPKTSSQSITMAQPSLRNVFHPNPQELVNKFAELFNAEEIKLSSLGVKSSLKWKYRHYCISFILFLI